MTDRDAEIVTRVRQGWSYTVLAAEYGISRQRVHQIAEKKKHAARQAVTRALKSGKLKYPAACTRCGKVGKVEAHHEDYNQALNVEFLCRRCHGAHMPRWWPLEHQFARRRRIIVGTGLCRLCRSMTERGNPYCSSRCSAAAEALGRATKSYESSRTARARTILRNPSVYKPSQVRWAKAMQSDNPPPPKWRTTYPGSPLDWAVREFNLTL